MSNKQSALSRELKQMWQELGDMWRSSTVAMRNGFRSLRGAKVDYVVMTLGGSLPERSGPPPRFAQRFLPLPPPSLSIETLNSRLHRVAEANNVKGVVFVLTGLEGGLAKLQNVRSAILRLRESGKKAVVYTPYLDLPHYYVATAADWVVAPAGASFDVLGLRMEPIFLKDALARIGVELNIIQISPYKSGGNTMSKANITPEQEEQINWLLDDNYDMVTSDIAQARNLTQDQVKALIDQAPLTVSEALKHGLLDHVAYEDELPALLGDQGAGNGDQPTANGQRSTASNQPPTTLLAWKKARKVLHEKPKRRAGKFIGVVSLEGSIVNGTSRQTPMPLPIPIIGGNTAGDQTINKLLRQAESLPNMAALIFHVDSPGGSALASDLIWRQVYRISRKKPVLVYMGNVAASGGYYVSSAAQHIMSQRGTITGSIGVFSGRATTDGFYEKTSINRAVLSRGEHSHLYGDSGPLTDELRQILWDGIVEIYKKFKTVVSEGRDLPYDGLDPICEGRVWTGRQALGHKLVDSHGDFLDAIKKAGELANLPANQHIPVVNIHSNSSQHLLPKPFELPEELLKFLTGEELKQFDGRPMLLCSQEFTFH